MKKWHPFGVRALIVAALFLGASVRAADLPAPANDPRGKKKDSYYYYGPNGLWKEFNAVTPEAAAKRLGRDTWIHWTWGNQKFLRRASVLAGNLPVPISIDFFRLLDSRNRDTRFRDLGLINEPNCKKATKPDDYGLWLDTVDPDPYQYYPVDYDIGSGRYRSGYFDEKYRLKNGDGSPTDLRHFGRPSGIVGLRLFANPQFDNKKWKVDEYFRNPGKVEPPYLVGFSCAFCHMGFDPNNPPADPEQPRWENLAANVGNQYFREGPIFLAKGRVIFGDKNPIDRLPIPGSVGLAATPLTFAPLLTASNLFPGKSSPVDLSDPYQTLGLTRDDFLYHYAVTQQPGTSETSRISYDFINNPNTITPLYGLRDRPTFTERTPWGKDVQVLHVLKDGADSVGLDWALLRVPINIGCEGDYWLDQLFDPLTGRRQRPVRVGELLAGLSDKEKLQILARFGPDVFKGVTPERILELKTRLRSPYGKEEFGDDAVETWRRIAPLKSYLLSYARPSALSDAADLATPAVRRDVAALLPDPKRVWYGAQIFARKCGNCHNSKPDDLQLIKDPSTWQNVVDFRSRNFLSDERRHPVVRSDKYPSLGTNMARALGTNAVHGDVWAEFSSHNYKSLPPLGRVTFDVPVFPPDGPGGDRPIRVTFDPPAGGRGYYRTPSLVSMWATAPYLHNNSVGDYYAYKGDATTGKTYVWISNDGTMWRAEGSNKWEPQGSADPDYRIDTSVKGRLLMFEDGMRKLLSPERRTRWVKRTSADCELIPDFSGTMRELMTGLTHDIVQKGLRDELQKQRLPEAEIDRILKDIDGAIRRAIANKMKKREEDFRTFLTSLRSKARENAAALFNSFLDEALEDLNQRLYSQDDAKKDDAKKEDARKTTTDQIRKYLQAEFNKRLKAIDDQLQSGSVLKIPQGTPVNLYANLNPSAMKYAALAHVRHADDPVALAKALLELSDCPDLVEDTGHTYGSDLSDEDKTNLIEFLKTL